METQIPEGPAASATAAASQSVYPFYFYGKGGTLFGIQIVNLLLIIVTLGIYYFWGKARVRRYIWGQVDFDGDRLSYHGTGKETLRGWLKAALIFGVPFLVAQNLPLFLGAPVVVQGIAFVLSLLMISLFMPYAIVGMRRYRYSRTALREIRFSWRGKWWDFAKQYLKWKALVFVTFSLYSPYSDMLCANYLTRRSYFGNRPFGFDGKGEDLLGSYILSLFLSLPTLGISILWYYYRKAKYTWNHTTFETARFNSTVTFGGLFRLYLVNGLLLIFTLGFASSWTRVRSMRYYLAHLTLEGQIDLAAIVQEAQEASATSEEVGDWLDADMDFG